MKKIFALSISMIVISACASSPEGFRKYDTFGEAPAAQPAEIQLAQAGERAQQAETPAAQETLYGTGRAPASVESDEDDSCECKKNSKPTSVPKTSRKNKKQ